MPTPEQNQALALGEIAHTVSSQNSSAEISTAKVEENWSVSDQINHYWSASPADQQTILDSIAHGIDLATRNEWNRFEHTLSAVGSFNTTFQDINVASTGIAMPRTLFAGGAIASILRTIGQNIKDDCLMARQYSKDDERIASHLRAKQLFFPRGFGISVRNEKKRRAFDAFCRDPQINVRKVVKDAITDWTITDNIVGVWNVQDGDVQWLTAMAAERCLYENYNGQERLTLVLDDAAMRELVTTFVNPGGPDQPGTTPNQQPRYPDRWKEAAKHGGILILDREQGDGWCVVTRARKYDGFARPSMRSVYFDLMIRDLLKAGEWACAIFLASCVRQFKIGPADGDVKVGPRAGMKDYPYRDTFNALCQQFATPSRARNLITDATVEIKHLVPDKETWSNAKYESCNARIDEWGGVPEQLRTGKGEGFSQGHMGFTRFEADGMDSREAAEELLLEGFFADPLVRRSRRLRLSEDDVLTCRWNRQILKDPKQVLEELKFLKNEGGADWRTIHEHLGYDHEAIKARMEAQHGEVDPDGETIWRPDFEAKQGMLNFEASAVGEAGRPPSGGPSMRRPRVSSSSSSSVSSSLPLLDLAPSLDGNGRQ